MLACKILWNKELAGGYLVVKEFELL